MDPSLFLKKALEQKQTLSLSMQKSLKLLQMSQEDLRCYLEEEVEKNPLLELVPKKYSYRLEKDVPYEISFYQYLYLQIKELFLDRKERRIALMLLEEIDEKGFLPENLALKGKSQEILSMLQTLDPPGVFARNLKESLLIQLKIRKEEDSIGFKLIETCFEDLLQKRFESIRKKLGIKDLKKVFQSLKRLSFRPSSGFDQKISTRIEVDLRIRKVSKGWRIEVVEDELPTLFLKDDLEEPLKSTKEKDTLKVFKAEARWLFRSLDKRKALLKKIGTLLIQKQKSYLEGKSSLLPIHMKELAEKLEVHESTLSRALSGKYIETPRGTLPLRSLILKNPEVLSLKDEILKLIEGEDKKAPLTDDEISLKLKEKGFKIARRTVAKYRFQLKIAGAKERKYF